MKFIVKTCRSLARVAPGILAAGFPKFLLHAHLNLGGLGACSPRKLLKFMYSEIESGNHFHQTNL